MKYLLVLIVGSFSLIPQSVWAIEFVAFEQYNDMVQLAPAFTPQWFFGTLERFPHTYVVVTDETQSVSLSVVVPASAESDIRPGVLIVRQALRGVEEVARLKADLDSWSTWYDWITNDTYLRGPTFTGMLEPGSYLIEVQTPDNQGSYALQIGTGVPIETAGYFGTLRALPAIKRWHGKSPWRSVESPMVYIPLVGLVLIGVGVWWYRRTKYA